MSLHYLLDGYNIIHQVPQLTHGSLENQRTRLVTWLAAERPQGRNPVTVVFDGKEDSFTSTMAGEIKVMFSYGQSADDCIKDIVERSKMPKNIVVVSDDRDIKIYTRDLGAKVLSVKEFAGESFKKKTPGSKTKSTGGEGQKVSLSQADKINKEMERIWLK